MVRGLLAIGGVLAMAATAQAEWPCAGEQHYRIAYSVKGHKPIAIGAYANGPVDKPVYGELTLSDLNGDGRADVVFQSACIQGPTAADRVRLHRIFAACGATAGVEDYVMVFEEEELCTRPITISVAAAASGWRGLLLSKQTPRGRCTEKATAAVAFDGRRYVAGAWTIAGKPCP